MDLWAMINVIGIAIIIVLCLIATLAIVAIVLLIAGFLLNARDQRACKRTVEDEYDGMLQALLSDALRLAQELHK